MAGNIRLTPEQLNIQAGQMSSLASQYESLFKSVNSTMKSANNNWSSNLAHNFSGKINSAGRSFSNVVGMLTSGARAAGNSAKTMDSIDKTLAKIMGGDGKKSSESSRSINLTGDKEKDIKNYFKDQYGKYVDSHRNSSEKGEKRETISDKVEHWVGNYKITEKTNVQTTYWSTSEGKKHYKAEFGHTTTAKDIFISEGCSRDEGIHILVNSLTFYGSENIDPAKGNAFVVGKTAWDLISLGFVAGDNNAGVGTMAAHIKAGYGLSLQAGISDGCIHVGGNAACLMGMDFDINLNYQKLWDGINGGIKYGIENFSG